VKPNRRAGEDAATSLEKAGRIEVAGTGRHFYSLVRMSDPRLAEYLEFLCFPSIFD